MSKRNLVTRQRGDREDVVQLIVTSAIKMVKSAPQKPTCFLVEPP